MYLLYSIPFVHNKNGENYFCFILLVKNLSLSLVDVFLLAIIRIHFDFIIWCNDRNLPKKPMMMETITWTINQCVLFPGESVNSFSWFRQPSCCRLTPEDLPPYCLLFMTRCLDRRKKFVVILSISQNCIRPLDLHCPLGFKSSSSSICPDCTNRRTPAGLWKSLVAPIR